MYCDLIYRECGALLVGADATGALPAPARSLRAGRRRPGGDSPTGPSIVDRAIDHFVMCSSQSSSSPHPGTPGSPSSPVRRPRRAGHGARSLATFEIFAALLVADATGALPAPLAACALAAARHATSVNTPRARIVARVSYTWRCPGASSEFARAPASESNRTAATASAEDKHHVPDPPRGPRRLGPARDEREHR